VIDVEQVASAHDAMEGEYDEIDDLWYAHLFNEIHDFLLRQIRFEPGARALDIGCGSGFQSLFLARAGYTVRGFDVSRRLVELARRKVAGWRPGMEPPWPGYTTRLGRFDRDQVELVNRADALRRGAEYVPPKFETANATDPDAYAPGDCSVVTCCGSVLSFVDEHEQVLSLMRQALRPGGLIVIEVEQRANLDLLWPLLDPLLGGALGYEQRLSESLGNLFAPSGRNVRIDYPFRLADGTEVVLPIWLFSVRYLLCLFERLGLEVVGHRGVHAVTNLVPSTLLHRAAPPPGRVKAFERLARVERKVSDHWPIWRLGCSVVFSLRRAD